MASRRLTSNQLQEIRQILIERKRIIETELQKNFTRFLEDTSDETTVVDVDEGDESRVDVGKEMSFQVMSRRTKELKEIKEALRRMDRGEYGICEECGNRIRFERLKAMPFAQLCRTCQDDSEKREKERQRPPRNPFRF